MELKTDEDISAYYRGLLIQNTIDIELRMEIIIGKFISMNNQERTMDMIEIFDFAIMDFFSKIKILKYIVKKYIPNFLNRVDIPRIDASLLFTDLTYIMEKRNKLAHKKPDLESYNRLKITWNVTDNYNIIRKEIKLTSEFREEYLDKCANSYVALIYLEVEVMQWAKNS